MLKLTKKADYALMAMKHLAEHPQGSSRSAKARLLISQHGINGGYTLARYA